MLAKFGRSTSLEGVPTLEHWNEVCKFGRSTSPEGVPTLEYWDEVRDEEQKQGKVGETPPSPPSLNFIFGGDFMKVGQKSSHGGARCRSAGGSGE